MEENYLYTKKDLMTIIDGTPALPYEMVVCAVGDLYSVFPEITKNLNTTIKTTRGVCLVSSLHEIVF